MHVITVAEARAQGSSPAAILSIAAWNDRVAKNPTADADRRATAAKTAPRLRQVALKMATEDGVELFGKRTSPSDAQATAKRRPQNDNRPKQAPAPAMPKKKRRAA